MAHRRVTFLPAVDAGLEAIEAHSILKYGPARATRTINAIFDKIEMLAFNPDTDSKPMRRTLSNGKVLRFAVVMRWWVVYEDREDENHLIVNAIVDSVRDLPRINFQPFEDDSE